VQIGTPPRRSFYVSRGCAPNGKPPRVRGRPAADNGCADVGGANPAGVGMFLCSSTLTTRSLSPPRRRGGVPPSPVSGFTTTVSSPPTRGCSAHRLQPGLGGRVLPAAAGGVFRTIPNSGQRLRGELSRRPLQAEEGAPVRVGFSRFSR
jgi:hypothetical protein